MWRLCTRWLNTVQRRLDFPSITFTSCLWNVPQAAPRRHPVHVREPHKSGRLKTILCTPTPIFSRRRDGGAGIDHHDVGGGLAGVVVLLLPLAGVVPLLLPLLAGVVALLLVLLRLCLWSVCGACVERVTADLPPNSVCGGETSTEFGV